MIIFLLRFRKIPVLNRISYFLLRLLGLDIPNKVKLGKNIEFPHWSNGLVIHPNTTIGNNVKIYQGVTIGRGDVFQSYKESSFKEIIIEDGVILGAGCKILNSKGTLTIGKNAIIGANAVVVNNIPANAIVAGVPAKIIKYNE